MLLKQYLLKTLVGSEASLLYIWANAIKSVGINSFLYKMCE